MATVYMGDQLHQKRYITDNCAVPVSKVVRLLLPILQQSLEQLHLRNAVYTCRLK